MNKTRLKKREELEKWEKYLYNTELKQLNKESFSGHQRLTNSAEFNENELKSKASIECIKK